MSAGFNLPDDFSWREFDLHFGDDQPPKPEESDTDPTPDEPEDKQEAMREFWRDGFEERT